MKYRFTLRANAGKLVLDVGAWSDAMPEAGAGLISSQMIEDFTTREYFGGQLDALLDDAEAGGDRYTWPDSPEIRGDVVNRLARLASPERWGRVGRDYTELIGKTPLLRLNSLAADCGATVLVKLECMEPNSVKDRPVLSMIEGAIERGELDVDTEVVEASSGNV
ncbi:MAG: pyridoxal-phosphate dependent enzyme, partial [Planctomycetota bacterium]